MGFAKYLYKLAHRIFKRGETGKTSDIEKFAGAMGPNYNGALECMFELRKQAIVATAIGNALDAHGQDRLMPRYSGENDDSYRLRLMNAYSYYQALGTKSSIITTLTRLGYTVNDIEELYLTDSDRWAEFIVSLGWDTETSIVELDMKPVRDTVKKMKPGHTKMAQIDISFQPVTIENIIGIESRSIHRTTVNYYGNRVIYLDGTWLLDGSELLGGYVNSQDNNATLRLIAGHQVQENIEAQLRIEHDLWYLDGSVLLDGSRLLDSYITEEIL